MSHTLSTKACAHILVMGVAGSGKSTVGQALADALRYEFLEGDAYHPPENVAKMAAGIPLTDADRVPWLRELASVLGERHRRGIGTVLACSALRRAYRDVLRSAIPIDEAYAVHLAADVAALDHRLATRAGHFMPTSLLASQLATLEPLHDDEAGVTIDATRALGVVIDQALAAVNAGVD